MTTSFDGWDSHNCLLLDYLTLMSRLPTCLYRWGIASHCQHEAKAYFGSGARFLQVFLNHKR